MKMAHMLQEIPLSNISATKGTIVAQLKSSSTMSCARRMDSGWRRCSLGLPSMADRYVWLCVREKTSIFPFGDSLARDVRVDSHTALRSTAGARRIAPKHVARRRDVTPRARDRT